MVGNKKLPFASEDRVLAIRAPEGLQPLDDVAHAWRRARTSSIVTGMMFCVSSFATATSRSSSALDLRVVALARARAAVRAIWRSAVVGS